MSLRLNETLYISVGEYEENENINAFELGYFLYFFRSAYVACLEEIRDSQLIIEFDALDDNAKIEYLDKLNTNILGKHLNNGVLDLWMKELDSDFDLEFTTISRNSPLKLGVQITGACLIALTMAVIFSGGKANIREGSFEIPPLATGIRALKETFMQPSPVSLPSERKDLHKKKKTKHKPDNKKPGQC